MTKIELVNGIVEVETDFSNKDKCKSIAGGKWNPNKKRWVYPETALLFIVNAFGKDDSTLNDAALQAYNKVWSVRNKIMEIKNGIGDYKHEFLMKHQVMCKDIAKFYDRFAFFMDTGTGKTLTSLEIIKDKQCKFLVICPKALIKSAWLEDQLKFYKELKLLPISRNMSKQDYRDIADAWGLKYNGSTSKDKIKEMLAFQANVCVINPESFKSDLEFIEELGFEGLVFDESTILKNPQSDICKKVTTYSKTVKYCYILSGKPNPNGLFDYFSQMRIIDPALLGDSFFRFREEYFMPTGYNGYDWKPKENSEMKIASRIDEKSIVIKKEDCLDLPEKTYIKRYIELSNNIKKTYLEMEKHQITALGEVNVAAPNKIASLMKLRQITSGFVMSYDGVLKLESNDKLKELEDVLEEIGDKPVIIWAQFKEEIRAIEQMLKRNKKTCVTAYSETKDVDESVRQFKHNEVQYIIAHPQTLKFGVTFVNCTYAVYYSQDFNYESYYQSHDRIYRKGQTKPCTYIFLLAEGTIDEVIFKALENKGSVAEVVENLVRRYKRDEI